MGVATMPVMCYICGREFGSASISIHIPQCEKKWDNEQQKLPKRHRRPAPDRPWNFDKVVKGELKGKNLQQAMDEYNTQAFEDFNKKALAQCKNCGRTFLPKSLEVHLRSCRPGTERYRSPTTILWPVRKPRSPTKTSLGSSN